MCNKEIKITKNLMQFVSILGCKQGDSKILDAIALIGEGFVLDKFAVEEIDEVFFQFYTKGISFIFDHDCLNTIMFFIAKHSGYTPCNIQLLKDVDVNSTIDDIVSAFGQPSLQGDFSLNFFWIKYDYKTYSIHYEFNPDTKLLEKITLSHQKPLSVSHPSQDNT
jgi:hypothetical protein